VLSNPYTGDESEISVPLPSELVTSTATPSAEGRVVQALEHPDGGLLLLGWSDDYNRVGLELVPEPNIAYLAYYDTVLGVVVPIWVVRSEDVGAINVWAWGLSYDEEDPRKIRWVQTSSIEGGDFYYEPYRFEVSLFELELPPLVDGPDTDFGSPVLVEGGIPMPPPTTPVLPPLPL
jgi:hypothetical protein